MAGFNQPGPFMPLHLLKMCVGIDSIEHLRRAQAARLRNQAEAGEAPVLRHWTRHAPVRADEITDGGSIYWIIRGSIRARQRITAIEKIADRSALKRCALVLDPDVVETVARPARPIQGWRYLAATDAPHDREDLGDGDDLPAAMAAELRELGLL